MRSSVASPVPGKSGVLNAILAWLSGCPDVVLWGVDLKGGMELRPWAPCLDRLAPTPTQAAELLADAVAILNTRAARLAEARQRLGQPSPAEPALVVVIDEYAELSDDAPAAVAHADSTARRGRAVAVTLLVATQRPTQKAMGSGAVRSQMDVRLCLRVRERRDVDLVLGQGMLAAGWHAHTLNAPGKFLLSTPEHTTPRRARAYLLTDTNVTTLATRHARTRPTLDDASRAATDNTSRNAGQQLAVPRPREDTETLSEPNVAEGMDPDKALLTALQQAPPGGASIPDLMTATGMRRTWVYHRLHHHIADGRAVQVSRGRWRANQPQP